MRVKFIDYITKMNKNGVRIEDRTNEHLMPVAHCIAGKNYFPIGIIGNFQEF